jgi:hypothetical protein
MAILTITMRRRIHLSVAMHKLHHNNNKIPLVTIQVQSLKLNNNNHNNSRLLEEASGQVSAAVVVAAYSNRIIRRAALYSTSELEAPKM